MVRFVMKKGMHARAGVAPREVAINLGERLEEHSRAEKELAGSPEHALAFDVE